MTSIVESWLPIPRTGGAYEASVYGRVRRALASPGAVAGRVLTPWMKQGYAYVVWMVDGKRHNSPVHALVAEAWLRLPDAGEEINHRDGDRANNNVFNLEWATHPENMRHSYRVLGRQAPYMKG